MNALINLAVKFSGLEWLWGALDGYKTYLSAAIAILTGLAGVLQEASPLLAAHNAGALFAFLKALPHDNSWIILVGGLGTLGIGHKLDKAAAPIVPVPAAPIPDAPTAG